MAAYPNRTQHCFYAQPFTHTSGTDTGSSILPEGYLPVETLIGGGGGLGIEPLNFQLVDDLLYHLSHSRPYSTYIYCWVAESITVDQIT